MRTPFFTCLIYYMSNWTWYSLSRSPSHLHLPSEFHLKNPTTATSKKAVMLFSPKVTVNVFTTDKMFVCLQWNYVPVALHSGDAINVRINQNETQINPVAVVAARAVASRRRPREMTICYLTFRLFAQPKPNAVVEVIIAFETNSCVKTFRSGTLNLFI